MAAPNKSNRLSPPLMWAFRSAAEARDSRKPAEVRDAREGQVAVASKKGSAAASITESTLRQEVWRDIETLLNAVALQSTERVVGRAPHVRSSILNFGLPDMAHRSIDELLANDRGMERQIETALRTFEPRLVPASIRVRRDSTVDPTALKVRFVVNADLVCRPVDVPIEFMADVELVSCRFAISRL
jgi:type VI secretion system protein ImpF